MNNKEMLKKLENSSSMLEKVLSFNQIIYDFINRDTSSAKDANEALEILTHNKEHYSELLNETFKLTDDAANELETVILKLNEIEEVSSVN